jgi:hypothetical protein
MKKRMSINPEPTNNPITLDEFHGSFSPPHCIASKRQHMEAIMRVIPMMSSCLSFWPSLVVWPISLWPFLFIRKKKNINIITTPPIGTFLVKTVSRGIANLDENKDRLVSVTHIQKHQRQLTCCVNVPPRTGPMPTQIPKTLMTMAM